jgi:hypothetical protein
MSVTEPEALGLRVTRLREHQWAPIQRATLIGVLSIVIGSLFVATYQLALGDPVPHRINAAVIGDRSANARTVAAVERVAYPRSIYIARPRAHPITMRGGSHYA